MRLLIFGDSAGTGFGTVTAHLGRQFLRLGVDVRFVSMNEASDGELDLPFAGRTAVIGQENGWLGGTDPKLVYERLKGTFRGTLFPDGWAPERALVIGDVGSLKLSPIFDFTPLNFPIWHYVPIEGVGLPPRWRNLWTDGNLRPIACSEFGASQIESLALPRPPMVYHGVDTEAFWEVSASRPITLRTKGPQGQPGLTILKTKNDCKRFFGIDPDMTVLFRADRNMPRKNYPSLFRAVAPVLHRNPKVMLVYHCRTLDQGGDLEDERSKYIPAVRDRMVSTGLHDNYNGVKVELLNALYNMADIYVSVSAEGFGLTIAEALQCGVPAVAMSYSSVPEVVGEAGVCVPLAELTDNIYSHFWARVNETEFANAVQKLVDSKGLRRALGGAGPIHVGTHFNWAKSTQQMYDLFAAADDFVWPEEGVAA